MKRSRPQDARRSLKAVWSSAAIYSCADGTFRIEPKWRKKYSRPGLFTRMHIASEVEAILAMPVKRIDWEKRTTAASSEGSK